MQSGGLTGIDAWQGQSQTYLVGEVLSFATMARVTEHALEISSRIARAPVRAVNHTRLAS